MYDFPNVVFWPGERTFRLPSAWRAWKEAVCRDPSLPEFNRQEWGWLTERPDTPTLDFRGPSETVERFARSIVPECQKKLRPLTDAVIASDTIIVVVIPIKKPTHQWTMCGYLGWFSEHIRASENVDSVVHMLPEQELASASLRALYTRLHPLVPCWHFDFSVQRSFRDQEFPENLMGEQRWITHLVDSGFMTRDAAECEAEEIVRYNPQYSEWVTTRAGAVNRLGIPKSLVLASTKGGLIVIPEVPDCTELLRILAETPRLQPGEEEEEKRPGAPSVSKKHEKPTDQYVLTPTLTPANAGNRRDANRLVGARNVTNNTTIEVPLGPKAFRYFLAFAVDSHTSEGQGINVTLGQPQVAGCRLPGGFFQGYPDKVAQTVNRPFQKCLGKHIKVVQRVRGEGHGPIRVAINQESFSVDLSVLGRASKDELRQLDSTIVSLLDQLPR